jgi:predicted ATPase/DNA-binding SARP family transcriptional activator
VRQSAAGGGLLIDDGANIEFRLLGPMEALKDGESVPLGGAKQRALLARLLLTPNEPVQVETLVEDLWGASAPASAAHSVQVYVSSLRKVIGKDLLLRTGGGYAVAVDAAQVDAARFEALVDQARRAGPGRRAPLLREALALWRGPALADFRYESFAQPAIAQLEEARFTALEDALEDELAAGGGALHLAELQALVAEHPLRERLRRQLILALYRAGRQADALDVYQETRRILVDELGIDPSPELQDLYKRVLNQDEALTPEVAPAAQVHLPVALTRLVGRTLELAELERLVIDDVRLLTLTGPGGTGKTRLAVALAERVAVTFDGGVWFVGLASVRDPSHVRAAIETTIAADEPLEAFLQRRRALIVLDNFEQLVDAAGDIAALLAAAADLTVIATSRTPLHLQGEHEYPVAPLPEPDAVELFVERAKAIKPDFAANGEVVGICRRLDGLPLALELAAARVKVLAPDALLARLERRLPLLTGGARDLPERQRTLSAVIEWSHDLLDADEQRLFARLAVFLGGCTLEAAEAVCDATLDLLAALVDKSLVREREGRFQMLETIREYASERLEASGDADELRRRHAADVRALAERAEPELQGPEQALWFARLESEHANVRAALAWALEQDPETALRTAGAAWRWWFVCGHWEEGETWLVRALEAAPGAPAEARASALAGAGTLARNRGETGVAIERLSEAVALRRQLGDRRGVAASTNNLANALFSTGDLAGARALYEESLVLQRELGLTFGIPSVLTNLGLIAVVEGDDARARELYEDGLEAAYASGQDTSIAITSCNLGVVALRCGEDERARTLFTESMARFRRLGMTQGIANTLDGFSGVALDRGDLARAARLMSAGQRLRTSIGASLDAWDQPEFDKRVATVVAGLGDEEFARAWAEGEQLPLEALVEDALAIEPAPAVSQR